MVDGKVRFVDVDESIDGFSADGHGVLHYIVSGQLRFFDGPGGAKAGWTCFFAGEPTIARKAQVSYRPWSR